MGVFSRLAEEVEAGVGYGFGHCFRVVRTIYGHTARGKVDCNVAYAGYGAYSFLNCGFAMRASHSFYFIDFLHGFICG